MFSLHDSNVSDTSQHAACLVVLLRYSRECIAGFRADTDSWEDKAEQTAWSTKLSRAPFKINKVSTQRASTLMWSTQHGVRLHASHLSAL